MYQLIPEDSLDGLARTGGGGALFLSVNEKTLLILSDGAPEKVALGDEDEVQMAGIANDEPGIVCGSILRASGGGELHLILAPERL